MAVIASGTTFTLPNYVGELFHITPRDTPVLSMLGGLHGGVPAFSKEITWQTDDNPAASQDNKLEGDEPTYAERSRTEVQNVLQIHQEGFQVSYTKAAAVGQLGGGTTTQAGRILGSQPVLDEVARQRDLKMAKIARDVEFSILQGTYSHTDTNVTARGMRGLLPAVATTDIAGGAGAPTTTMINDLVKGMYDSGAPFDNVVMVCGSLQKQRIGALYTFAPESRNVGGTNLQVLETDFVNFPIVVDRHMPADDVLLIDLAHIRLRFLEVPGKGHFFMEEMGKTHAAWRFQIYGEIGLEYGPELWHGKITNLATS